LVVVVEPDVLSVVPEFIHFSQHLHRGVWFYAPHPLVVLHNFSDGEMPLDAMIEKVGPSINAPLVGRPVRGP
jgi:hypothetical protein